MNSSKKQVILGALILALGAAVYLNWQFTSAVPDTDVLNSATVNADIEDSSSISDEDIGIAQLVNNSYIETVNDTTEFAETFEDVDEVNATEVLSEARIDRQSSRDNALALLEEILADESANDEAKKTAIDESAKIAQEMLMESTAENLLSAKGIEDVVVYVGNDKCNVVVNGLADNTLIIQDIITKETGLTLDKIQIIDIN